MNAIWSRATAAAAALLWLTFAAASEDIPKFKVLGCESGCAKWTDPVPVGSHSLTFPMSELWDPGDTWPEAFVVVHFTITAEGTVKDPVVEKLIGGPRFASRALDAVKDWRYKPATADGVPVERPNWRTEIAFYLHPLVTGAGEDTYNAYKKARRLIEDGKIDEANTILIAALTKPRLSFYEREMLSLVLALVYTQKHDYLTAREYIEAATFLDAKFLNKDGRDMAIRQRIKLDAVTGQLGDALEWYGILAKQETLAADDDATKLVEKIKARLADPNPINLQARIPPDGPLAPWTHALLRRHFGFAKVTGKIDHFQLDCDQKKIVSPVSETAEWHVPKSWSGCELLVYGEPGTTFFLMEANE